MSITDKDPPGCPDAPFAIILIISRLSCLQRAGKSFLFMCGLLICDGASQKETVDALTEEFALVEENFVSVEELDHSLEHILRYSELPIEQTQQFEADVRAFAALSDKMSTDDNARELRRNILKQYYPLYKAVYYKEYHSTEETPIEIDLFLRYGFLSETLLTEELLEELLSLDNDRSGRGDCRVYDMKEWLTEVYEGRKSPSKSEFDLDYEDFLERNPGAKIYYATTKAPQTYADVKYEDDCFIMFGKESAGIPEEILVENEETTIRIPMYGEIRSLNLGNSVAIVLYEALRQQGFPKLNPMGHLHHSHWQDGTV